MFHASRAASGRPKGRAKESPPRSRGPFAQPDAGTDVRANTCPEVRADVRAHSCADRDADACADVGSYTCDDIADLDAHSCCNN